MRYFREFFIGGIVVISILFLFIIGKGYVSGGKSLFSEGKSWIFPSPIRKDQDLRPFVSMDEMKEYITRADMNDFTPFTQKAISTKGFATEGISKDSSEGALMKEGSGTQVSTHFSQTNTQVLGIDEPDSVKTDGASLFVSQASILRDVIFTKPSTSFNAVGKESLTVFPYRKAVHIADIQLDEGLAEAGNIDGKSGNLLLSNGVLAVFDTDGIFGYDVKDIKNPKKLWVIELKEGSIVDARLLQNKLYIVEKTILKHESPCPFVPLVYGGKEMEITCSDIYHPYAPVPVSSVYTLVRVNMETGLIEKKKSVVGSDTLAMTLFEGGLYAWYPEYKSISNVMYDFFRAHNTLISQEFFLRLEKLREYEISEQSKTQELFYEIENYQATLDPDSRLKFQNDLENTLLQYMGTHKRELTQTQIFKLDVNTLEVQESGSIPGIIHNQFSVDEYLGMLRVATTVGTYSGYFWNAPQGESDIYILDNQLNVQGSVQGMGYGEQIYATRFLGDRGYVVTFKETDPFYVLDLSKPKSPKISGELKIPGYSSYLHPLTKDRVLGIGKEEDGVKATLFDVSDAGNPKEISTVILDEYWSDLLVTHHAFTIKEESEIFFFPGVKGGYIFSYTDNVIKLIKTISNEDIQRAVYVGDLWYFVGEDGIVSYSENGWKKTGEVKWEVAE